MPAFERSKSRRTLPQPIRTPHAENSPCRIGRGLLPASRIIGSGSGSLPPVKAMLCCDWMLHALHLAGVEPDLQTLRTSQMLCSALGSEFYFSRRSIGRGGDYRNAPHAAISLRFASGAQADLIHAWDRTALIAALGAALPTVFSPAAPLTSRDAGWLRLAAPRQSVHLIAATEAQRADWERWGAAALRCHVIPPAVDRRRLPPKRNDWLREQLGLAHDDYVILAPGETTSASGHRMAVWATSILHVLDDRYRLLLWGRGRDLHRASSLAGRLAQRRLLVIAERQLGRSIEFEELLGVADCAMVAARHDIPMLPILQCMAAGLPIVASQSPMVLELLQNDQAALLVKDGTPRGLASSILLLREDPALARRVSQLAAGEAAARFSPAPFISRIRQVYWASGMSGGDPPPQISASSFEPVIEHAGG